MVPDGTETPPYDPTQEPAPSTDAPTQEPPPQGSDGPPAGHDGERPPGSCLDNDGNVTQNC